MSSSTSSDRDVIVGIDLGTTNSEIAAFHDGRVRVLGPGPRRILPSCVGLSPAGELLVGEAARNQLVLHPERTIRSIKRKMGSDEKVALGDRALTPPEVSALILKELAGWAHRQLGQAVRKAVITVPAFFSDVQRKATREAGELAGLEVVRVLNEPTAASLAYGSPGDSAQTSLVYDLGGGTFDVSIVTTQADVTEVLASHGNTRLGGDDFDQLVLGRLLRAFRERHDVDLDGHRSALARLAWAAEEAKIRLSSEPYVRIREEALITVGGRPLDLELELSLDEYEEMIRPLLETTLESVTRALADAGKRPADLDAILLVGGATRTPLVTRLLEKSCGITPRQDVDPDLCVALGAGTLASRMAGLQVERVLVDVSPYSFGPSYLGDKDGRPYAHCYHPIICRNTPLPVTRTERYSTSYDAQTRVDLTIYQGDDPDALKNVPVGDFTVEGLSKVDGPNEVLCRMSLDLDGILQVTATEKRTGLSKQVTIEGACQRRSEAEIAAARERLESLFALKGHEEDDFADEDDSDGLDAIPLEDDAPSALDRETPEEESGDPAWDRAVQDARALLERSRAVLDRLHEEDKEEAINLHEEIDSSIDRRDPALLAQARAKLSELLFFVEGR